MISTFNLDKLHALLEDFYRLAKIRITVFDENFHELTAYPARISSFCEVIRTDPKAANACRFCDEHACKKAARGHQPFTYRCHAGLTECIAPLFMGNLPIGYLLFGHVFSYESHEMGWEHIRNLCKDYRIDMTKLKTAVFQQPVISKDFITSASHILQAVAYYLCLERMVSLHRQALPVQLDAYIQANYTKKLTAEQICAHFNMGKTKLYDIVRESYGMGLAEYIRKLRIDRAKELLTQNSDLSLAEIGAMCGFEDYNYFITVFKRLTGMPPKTYAKRQTK